MSLAFLFVGLLWLQNANGRGLLNKPEYGTIAVTFDGVTLPLSKTSFAFTFPQCPLSSRLLNIERFDSVAQLEGADGGSKIEVRYVYLIGRLSGDHNNCAVKLEDTVLKYEIEGDLKRRTHFFLSFEAPTKITSFNNGEK